MERHWAVQFDEKRPGMVRVHTWPASLRCRPELKKKKQVTKEGKQDESITTRVTEVKRGLKVDSLNEKGHGRWKCRLRKWQ